MDVIAQLAQASVESPTAATWIALLSGALGGPIFSIWFAYYMVTTHLPQQTENFRADIRHIMDQKFQGDMALAKAIDEIRDTIRETHMREERRDELRERERQARQQ